METMKDIRAHFASAKEGEYNALFQHYENDERSGVQKLIQQYRKKLQVLENERARTEIMKEYEHKYEHLGYLCGIDEVGRGPLAGPVVACAVILPKDCDILWLNDSKKLTAKKREELYDVSWKVQFLLESEWQVRKELMRSISCRQPMRQCVRR